MAENDPALYQKHISSYMHCSSGGQCAQRPLVTNRRGLRLSTSNKRLCIAGSDALGRAACLQRKQGPDTMRAAGKCGLHAAAQGHAWRAETSCALRAVMLSAEWRASTCAISCAMMPATSSSPFMSCVSPAEQQQRCHSEGGINERDLLCTCANACTRALATSCSAPISYVVSGKAQNTALTIAACRNCCALWHHFVRDGARHWRSIWTHSETLAQFLKHRRCQEQGKRAPVNTVTKPSGMAIAMSPW